jgi:hypothetical protein
MLHRTGPAAFQQINDVLDKWMNKGWAGAVAAASASTE